MNDEDSAASRDDDEEIDGVGDDPLNACIQAAFSARAAQSRPAFDAVRYEFGEILGQGGLGVVTRARDHFLGRDVAIKEMQPAVRCDAEAKRRFVDEARICASLEHPGVLPVYDLGEREASTFFAMKLIDGRDLAAILAGRRSPNSESEHGDLVAIFERVVETMAFAHSKGIVHRDLKPSNIMVGAFGEVHVVDWGVAKILGRHAERVDDAAQRAFDTVTESVAGSVLGTLPYMPPEQARGEVQCTNATADVFALGAILCEILTGEPPYGRVQGLARAELQRRVREADLTDAERRLRATSVDTALADLALGCLRAEASERPSHAGIVLESLRRIQRVKREREERERARAATARLRRRVLAVLGVVLIVAATSVWISREDARRSLERFELLSWVVKLREARKLEPTVWPPLPEHRERMQAWLEEHANPLLDARATIRASVVDLRAQAEPWDATQRAADRARIEDALAEARATSSMFDPSSPYYANERAKRSRESWERDRDRARQAVVELEARVEERHSYHFANKEQAYLHEALAEVLADLDRFEAVCAHVRRGMVWAGLVEQRSILDQSEAWKNVREAIRTSPHYGGLDLKPQLGLVPIGPNPSGLWDFLDLGSAAASAATPRRTTEGRLELVEGSGIVFVLVPGGTAAAGSQGVDPSAARYDPASMPQERPLARARLAPYFLAAHEVTQAQWERLSGLPNPSQHGPGSILAAGEDPVDGRHPVENVSWIEAMDVLERWGMTLPSELQWEHAARAGSTTPYHFGVDEARFVDFENIRDTSYGKSNDWQPSGSDGRRAHGPVASFLPNPWGFCDMLGNVSEWCIDASTLHDTPARDGDGIFEAGMPGLRAVRGGSFHSVPRLARCSFRDRDDESSRSEDRGFRPIRALMTR
ncbi:MAG: SUMF1/EgtB/PvdO family nonheme iron enzyme [Planctomycetes bacterium]|nr:SUMF1/EgtB/PvdO family nonheme iron enzyme [Planctomycetota bacterium]MCB9919402.1 SUMF1/EgtB/PvdO family nonheme iron enzyme [Planctomycetota bacterium]